MLVADAKCEKTEFAIRKQDDGVIQYTSEVSDIMDSKYQSDYSCDIIFWDVGAPPLTSDPGFLTWPFAVCI